MPVGQLGLIWCEWCESLSTRSLKGPMVLQKRYPIGPLKTLEVLFFRDELFKESQFPILINQSNTCTELDTGPFTIGQFR